MLHRENEGQAPMLRRILCQVRDKAVFLNNKKATPLELYSKGQFSKNTVYLERGIPYFAFVGQMQCLSGKMTSHR